MTSTPPWNRVRWPAETACSEWMIDPPRTSATTTETRRRFSMVTSQYGVARDAARRKRAVHDSHPFAGIAHVSPDRRQPRDLLRSCELAEEITKRGAIM